MAKNPNDQFAEFAASVVRSLPRDMDLTVMQGWIENQDLLHNVLREALSPAGLSNEASAKAENTYPLTVNYEMSVEDAVKLGHYDHVNSDINAQNFSVTGNGRQKVIIELAHYGRGMTSEAVLKDFESRGLRPTILPELLAFGSAYPEKQREFPIIALGSVWQGRDGCLRMAFLGRWGAGRGLYLGWVGGGWDGGCRFAAVCK